MTLLVGSLVASLAEYAAPLHIVFEGAAGALVAGLWQGLLLSVAAASLLRLVPRGTAALRFAVWLAVFCMSVAMPFVDLPGVTIAGRSVAATGAHMVIDPRWSYLLSGLWLAASIYRMGELLLQAADLRALWKSAVPVPDESLNGLETTLAVRGRRVGLCTSNELDRPSVIGFLAPRILIPAWLLEQLTAVELNHIVLHEMEHLRRRDDWVNLLQKIGLVLLPLNPALFWIDRRLSTERELACDDGVLEQTKMPRAYAASLASVAERRLDHRALRRSRVLALAATGLRRRRSELGQRIESILSTRAPANRVLAGGLAAAMVVVVMAFAAGLTRMPQLVSFGGNESAPQVAAITPGDQPRLVSPITVDRAAAGYRDVSFREPAKVPVAKRKAVYAKPIQFTQPAQVVGAFTSTAESPPMTRQQFVVLTSWHGDQHVTRVAVATPDGKFVLLPYAAVPTEAGWLLVKL